VGDARTWRPGWPKVPAAPERDAVMIVGVAQVPEAPGLAARRGGFAPGPAG
jgi:hypothetical protein